MYVTYTRIYGWSDYGGESSYQPGYRLENMMWMTLLVYDYIIPGDIIGWHIANSGHQTGALDVAKNYGILVSDTKQLIEIICNSKIIRREKEPVKFLRSLMKEENYTY